MKIKTEKKINTEKKLEYWVNMICESPSLLHEKNGFKKFQLYTNVNKHLWIS